MKTDAALKRDVEAELAWDPAIRSSSIRVAARHGVVTLGGHVRSHAERCAAAQALRRVAGVKGIVLELDVLLPPEDRRGDTDIALSAEQALRWHAQVPERLEVVVAKGWVTVRGELEWEYQRRSVDEALRSLSGIVGFSNEVTLRPSMKPIDLQHRIAEALKRQAEPEPRHMDIAVDGATVTLRGTVGSWHERDAAQDVAWSAPGVRAVINELRIG